MDDFESLWGNIRDTPEGVNQNWISSERGTDTAWVVLSFCPFEQDLFGDHNAVALLRYVHGPVLQQLLVCLRFGRTDENVYILENTELIMPPVLSLWLTHR